MAPSRQPVSGSNTRPLNSLPACLRLGTERIYFFCRENDYTFQVSENKENRKIFGPKRDEISEQLRILHN